MTTGIPLPDDAQLDPVTLAQLALRPPVALYRMVAYAPRLLAPFMSMVVGNFNDLGIPAPMREAIILRVARHHRSGYEIHHHRRIATAAGLSEATIADLLAADGAADKFDASIADAAALADVLLTDRPPPAELVARLRDRFGDRGYVEMALLVGFYRMVATFISATGLTPEHDDRVHVAREPGGA